MVFIHSFIHSFIYSFIYLFIYLHDSSTGAGINPQSMAPIMLLSYRKIPIISPGAYFWSKGLFAGFFLGGLIFGGRGS